jgi:hypothetical protein
LLKDTRKPRKTCVKVAGPASKVKTSIHTVQQIHNTQYNKYTTHSTTNTQYNQYPVQQITQKKAYDIPNMEKV